ncbi:hypothetical protein [Rhizobium hidalgonense]|uniref:Endonuclease n=1 Tax=Rhizobium hidalgonense TaxID=1538159 RepID=A0ABX4JH92_9HYPH|nr:hypothetical protein [Rhizobium hidalgonense]PDT19433.1 hypothetical protein CO674_33055 [Rhizobium hidalgonense]PON05014.1 hypothetical protein ATY29_23935 [Rhizobium hidalgonense]
MIFVTRGDEEPASLSSVATIAQAQAAASHYATWVAGDPGFDAFTRYREYDVKQMLRTLFHGKCAYCEKFIEKGISEVEHYRPKGAVDGADHPGYWWLAFKWSNLLPTCPGCNKGLKHHLVTADMTIAEVEVMQATEPRIIMGKATQFPVGAPRLAAVSDDHFAEQPYLIDPTRTNPAPELSWRHHADYSVVEPAQDGTGSSILGTETIRCVALNRLDLVQSRTAILNRLKTNRTRIMEDLERDVGDELDPVLIRIHLRGALRRVEDMKQSCKPDQPFSAMSTAYVDAFEVELREWLEAKLAGG